MRSSAFLARSNIIYHLGKENAAELKFDKNNYYGIRK